MWQITYEKEILCLQLTSVAGAVGDRQRQNSKRNSKTTLVRMFNKCCTCTSVAFSQEFKIGHLKCAFGSAKMNNL